MPHMPMIPEMQYRKPAAKVSVRRKQRSAGNTLIEFTLVGIPLIFILISIFEIARGMWIYHTLAYAAKEGTRFAIVRGNDCSINGNTCQSGSSGVISVADAANAIKYSAMGLDPSQLQVRFVSSTQTIAYQTLQSALNDTTDFWPSSAAGDVGGNPGSDVEVDLKYPFTSAIALFWPGAGPGQVWGTFTLPATSKEQIQF